MQLYGTAPSPFTRKVRVVLLELGLEHDFRLITALLSNSSSDFANNPLLQFPVLVDGDRQIIDSSLITQYLLETHATDRSPICFLPKSGDVWLHRKRLLIINGGMDAGVKIVRARRSEIPDFEKYVMFQQEKAAIIDSLAWLESDLAKAETTGLYLAGPITHLEISLQCYLDWGLFRNIIPSLDEYPRLKAFNSYHQSRPSFLRTHPLQSAQ